MGTWDIGFFDNDMACDWENSLKDSKDMAKIRKPFEKVISNKDDTLDIDLANRALASAEALCRLIHKDGERTSYTTHIDAWVDDFSQVISPEYKELAIKAVELIIKDDSELKQYWKLRGELDSWLPKVSNLLQRLTTEKSN